MQIPCFRCYSTQVVYCSRPPSGGALLGVVGLRGNALYFSMPAPRRRPRKKVQKRLSDLTKFIKIWTNYVEEWRPSHRVLRPLKRQMTVFPSMCHKAWSLSSRNCLWALCQKSKIVYNFFKNMGRCFLYRISLLRRRSIRGCSDRRVCGGLCSNRKKRVQTYLLDVRFWQLWVIIVRSAATDYDTYYDRSVSEPWPVGFCFMLKLTPHGGPNLRNGCSLIVWILWLAPLCVRTAQSAKHRFTACPVQISVEKMLNFLKIP